MKWTKQPQENPQEKYNNKNFYYCLISIILIIITVPSTYYLTSKNNNFKFEKEKEEIINFYLDNNERILNQNIKLKKLLKKQNQGEECVSKNSPI